MACLGVELRCVRVMVNESGSMGRLGWGASFQLCQLRCSFEAVAVAS